VATAYGWADIDLGHGFRENKHGLLYTLSEVAKETILSRLLALNHQRYEKESPVGLLDKRVKSPNKGISRKNKIEDNTAQGGLYL
jgi:hypothetical protein